MNEKLNHRPFCFFFAHDKAIYPILVLLSQAILYIENRLNTTSSLPCHYNQREDSLTNQTASSPIRAFLIQKRTSAMNVRWNGAFTSVIGTKLHVLVGKLEYCQLETITVLVLAVLNTEFAC